MPKMIFAEVHPYQKLKRIFTKLSQLNYVQRIATWDESVMMPEGAGETRAQALATLNGVMNYKLRSKKVKDLIDAAKQENSLTGWDHANLVLMEKKHIRSASIPAKLTEQYTKESFACMQAWRKLRAQNNWQDFLPNITRVFKMTKEIAERRADFFQVSAYDEMLDEYASGFSQAKIEPIFSGLKQNLPELIKKIMSKQTNEAIKTPIGPFAIEQQKMLGLDVMRSLGFNFNQGRLDESHHPFCDGHPNDVRITTRYNENEFISSISGICHETGHGLYEQGLPRAWIDQPVGKVDNMAMHESQSLLIEMQVCLSPAFYQYLIPQTQQRFGQQEALTADNLYKLVTRVKPGLIRVDADEVTYPLHIIIRYEIEKALFKGELTIQDLPSYWNELMIKYLGINTKDNNKDGVMQDVHWPCGAFGYFPAYTLGRIIAAQLFATYMIAEPHCHENFKQGNFQSLNTWLHENIYLQASSLRIEDLLMKVTGKKLDSTFFIDHIRQRYL